MKTSIAFLGPEGSFAHLAAQTRFGKKSTFVPCQSIKDVFDYVARDESRLGIVPIENSSGGQIQDTVGCFLEHDYDGLYIRESLAVNVKLALMAKSKSKKDIRVVYSHMAPLHHCEAWLNEHLPGVPREEVSSTSKAVQQAAKEKGAAAIGNRLSGEIYDLEVLEFPIQDEIQNVTQFFLFGHEQNKTKNTDRISIIITIPNTPGSLVNLLGPLKDEKLNMSRIISRPIQGHPETYAFLIDLEAKPDQVNFKRAIAKAAKITDSLRILGAYPVLEKYES